jgi:hypothetical protein
MVKIIDSNCIYFVGKVYEVMLQLAAINDKSITLAEYIKQQAYMYKNSLN